MRPKECRESGQNDLFRSRLDQILNLEHELAKLARLIEWQFLETRFGEVYSDGPGQPPLPTRLMAGLCLLKYTFSLSDEELCARWIENPYYQYFCGEEFFQHQAPFDRSSLTRWRQRMGEDKLKSLLQETLAIAAKTGALNAQDLRHVIVDTTVQPKNAMFPTDAKLVHGAREILVRKAQALGLVLRQSYRRVGKLMLIKHQRYAHAKQFNRANRTLRKLKTFLGRVMRDISRKIRGNEALQAEFATPLSLARRVRDQQKREPGSKVYSLHAPEVECIGKGKVHRPYEFGVKVSLATTITSAKGGQFVVHAKALPGNPYDGDTLKTVIPEIEAITGGALARIIADAGYRGHNAPPTHTFKIYTSGQKRRMTPSIKRVMKRRAAVEPVIGHVKNEHRMDRNYLAGRHGDAINAVLAAVGYNLSLLLRWFRFQLCQILLLLTDPHTRRAIFNPA